MPLRDHFRPSVSNRVSWEEIHGMWPARIVLQLRTVLPKGYVAGPKIHARSQVESMWQHSSKTMRASQMPRAMAALRPPLGTAEPTVAVETEVPDYDEYEVCIYDAERGRQLVAAIELVSPGNKDRPEKRNAFVGKCAALLQKGVAVSIVDVVTPRQFNLYAELLHFLGQNDPTLGDPLPHLYAASCRWRPQDKADAAANLVARAYVGSTVTHTTAVADGQAGGAAGPGAKLRTGMPRFVAHLTVAE